MRKKNTETEVAQRKRRPREILEFKLTKSMETFSINPPTELEEENSMNSVFSLGTLFQFSRNLNKTFF